MTPWSLFTSNLAHNYHLGTKLLCLFQLIIQTQTISPQNQNNILLLREMLNQILHHHLGNHTRDTSLSTDMALLTLSRLLLF